MAFPCSYGFVGSVKRCPSTCEYQSVGPNGATAADGIASIFAHELSEIISDPDATAWCAWAALSWVASADAIAAAGIVTREILSVHGDNTVFVVH